MAATFGPDMMIVDLPATDRLDHGMMHTMDAHGQLSSSPQTSPRSNQPPPNPPFVFPARPSSSSAPSSSPWAIGRRPRSAIEPRIAVLDSNTEIENPKPRSPALPSFSFNPGASLPSTLSPENAFLSPTFPPSAPSSPRTAAARPGGHGHRRGGSEFVGGKIRDGDSITVTNSSPTKSESGMASPMLQPTKPRRGHAHRRSTAISSHDLASIILPSANHNLRGNSAPSSPAFPDRAANNDFPNLPQQATKPEPMSLPDSETRTDANGNKTPVPLEDERPAKPAARNRVGFSDTLEYIPRPLSLVSSDASSTATARPGHSVSDSISSLISLSTGDRELNSPLGLSSTPRLSDSRPSTAGAVLERVLSTQEEEENLILRSPKRRGSIPFLGSLPPTLPLSPATPSPTRSAKKWTFFSREPSATGSPTRPQAESPVASGSHASSPVIGRESTDKRPEMLAFEPELKLSNLKPLTKKRSKKQKKVKTWAGIILSRKSKYRYGKQKRRTPTPPPIRFTDELGCLDQNTTNMALNPEPMVPTFTVTGTSEADDMEAWTFPKLNSVSDEDMTYQMIDLDAALGPFNTPLPQNPEWEAAQRAGGHAKKQLHSAAGMSRFTGPGMHYHHRRAESAPEMVPFEGGRLGFRRFGSSSTMADVFEEDEEEEDDESTKSSTGNSTPLAETTAAEKSETTALVEETISSLAVQQEPLPSTSSVSLPLAGGFQYPSWATKSVSVHSTSSTKEEAPDTVAIIPPGSPGDSASLNHCSGSATPSPRHVFRPKELAPVEVGPLNLPPSSLGPISPFSMTQSSAFPSPRTPLSYDAHRISTAPSSIVEDNFQSLLMGEPGPEVRISVDDIPSLTSSNSTTTRESLFPQHPQARNPPLNELPRPASFTSTAFGRRRSSLASLSRLISSSHGERSKLSIEVPMDSEPEKKAKLSKTKRLSRMVQFWKSKENETA